MTRQRVIELDLGPGGLFAVALGLCGLAIVGGALALIGGALARLLVTLAAWGWSLFGLA